MNIIFRLLPLFVLLSFSLSAQNLTAEFDKYLNEYYENKNIPSISAGVAQNGKIIWQGARGYADVENFVYAGPSSVYRIASISKPITAVAIMQLVENGKIKLDDDAAKFISNFPYKRWKFTIRQLLNHTSGIRGYKNGEFDSKDFYPSTKDAVELISKDTLRFQPGTKYLYSTLAYNLLAAIIEKTSGLTYTEYVQKNIFTPAGMNSTYAELQPSIVFNRASGYVKDDYRKLKNAPLADLSIKYAGGGIISTSGDLLKFAMALLDGKLIKPESLDTMLIPARLPDGTSTDYGLAFVISRDEKERMYFQHSGGGTGFVSWIVIYPKEKIAAVHLINLRDRNLNNPAFALAGIALKEKYKSPPRSLADDLLSITMETNLDSAIAFFESIDTSVNKKYNINFDEMILFGNDLININRSSDAVYYFKYLAGKYPPGAKLFIGLADAYKKDGNKGLALKNYRAALKIDPKNKYAESEIKKLSGS